jgi:hypothetical protein
MKLRLLFAVSAAPSRWLPCHRNRCSRLPMASPHKKTKILICTDYDSPSIIHASGRKNAVGLPCLFRNSVYSMPY